MNVKDLFSLSRPIILYMPSCIALNLILKKYKCIYHHSPLKYRYSAGLRVTRKILRPLSAL